jgi:hypothetical protein
VGVEAEDWVRTEIIVHDFVGERSEERERGAGAYILLL